MKVEGTKTLNAPRGEVWAVLNDPARMAKTMPGVESFDIIDDKRWRANVKIPLGLGGLKMALDLEKTEERSPEYAQMRIKGNGVGAMLNMTTAFTLAENGEATDMKWEAEIGIAGPVGAMGQRVLQPIVNQQVTQVLNSLEREVQSGGGSTEPAGSGGTGAGAGDGGS
jgi:carbon monoxide dehydrogenase subunit G